MNKSCWLYPQETLAASSYRGHCNDSDKLFVGMQFRHILENIRIEQFFGYIFLCLNILLKDVNHLR